MLKVPKLRFCSQCGKHCRNKIYVFESKDYCETHWRERLEWDERRTLVVREIKRMVDYEAAVQRLDGDVVPHEPDHAKDWVPYIRDLCGLAEYGLAHDDKKIFVHWFTRAVWAWGLKEAQE